MPESGPRGGSVSYKSRVPKVSLFTGSEALGEAPAQTSPLPQELSYSCKHVLLPVGPAHGKNSSVERNLSTRGDKESQYTGRCVCKPSGSRTRHRQSSGTSMKHHTLIFSKGERGAFIQSFPQTSSVFA